MVRRYRSPSLLIFFCGSLSPEFLRPGRNPRKQPTSRLFGNRYGSPSSGIGQRDLRSYTLPLLEQEHFRVHFFCDFLHPFVVLLNALVQRFDLPSYPSEPRSAQRASRGEKVPAYKLRLCWCCPLHRSCVRRLPRSLDRRPTRQRRNSSGRSRLACPLPWTTSQCCSGLRYPASVSTSAGSCSPAPGWSHR